MQRILRDAPARDRLLPDELVSNAMKRYANTTFDYSENVSVLLLRVSEFRSHGMMLDKIPLSPYGRNGIANAIGASAASGVTESRPTTPAKTKDGTPSESPLETDVKLEDQILDVPSIKISHSVHSLDRQQNRDRPTDTSSAAKADAVPAEPFNSSPQPPDQHDITVLTTPKPAPPIVDSSSKPEHSTAQQQAYTDSEPVPTPPIINSNGTTTDADADDDPYLEKPNEEVRPVLHKSHSYNSSQEPEEYSAINVITNNAVLRPRNINRQGKKRNSLEVKETYHADPKGTTSARSLQEVEMPNNRDPVVSNSSSINLDGSQSEIANSNAAGAPGSAGNSVGRFASQPRITGGGVARVSQSSIDSSRNKSRSASRQDMVMNSKAGNGKTLSASKVNIVGRRESNTSSSIGRRESSTNSSNSVNSRKELSSNLPVSQSPESHSPASQSASGSKRNSSYIDVSAPSAAPGSAVETTTKANGPAM